MRLAATLMASAASSLFIAAAATQAGPTGDNALMKLQRFSDHGLHDALCEPDDTALSRPVHARARARVSKCVVLDHSTAALSRVGAGWCRRHGRLELRDLFHSGNLAANLLCPVPSGGRLVSVATQHAPLPRCQ